MSEDKTWKREEGVAEIVSEVAPLINRTPGLLSLLYDINMLPEQTVTRAGAIRLAGLCAVWEQMSAHAERIKQLEEALRQASKYVNDDYILSDSEASLKLFTHIMALLNGGSNEHA